MRTIEIYADSVKLKMRQLPSTPLCEPDPRGQEADRPGFLALGSRCIRPSSTPEADAAVF